MYKFATHWDFFFLNFSRGVCLNFCFFMHGSLERGGNAMYKCASYSSNIKALKWYATHMLLCKVNFSLGFNLRTSK